MSDCRCADRGLPAGTCGVCEPSHTEGKALAALKALQAEYAGQQTSSIAEDLTEQLAKMELATRENDLTRKRNANRKAGDLLALLCDRRGIDVLHRDVTRAGSARLGKHTPTPRSTAVPHYDPSKPRGKR